jgi:hypothetical protein
MLDVTLEPHPCTRFPAALITISDQPPATLAAPLDQIARRPGAPAAMLGTTAAYLARYIGAPKSDLKLDTVDAALSGFAAYLGQITRKNGSPLMRNSIRSYVNYAHILLALARDSAGRRRQVRRNLRGNPCSGLDRLHSFPKAAQAWYGSPVNATRRPRLSMTRIWTHSSGSKATPAGDQSTPGRSPERSERLSQKPD